MNIKTIVLLTTIIIATTISGCISEKTPEQLSPPAPPAPKYTADIISISDVTDKYPDVSGGVGWYNPVTRQKVSRYINPNLGTINNRVVVLLTVTTTSETKLGLTLTPSPKQGVFFYDIHRLDWDGRSLSRYSKHQQDARQVYEILIEYGVPKKEELTVNNGQDMALQIYSTSTRDAFKIVFSEQNTRSDGFS